MQNILQVSTDLVDPYLRTDYWRDVTRPLFDSLPCQSSLYPDMEGTFGVKMAGSIMFCNATFSPQRYSRNLKIISRSGLEDFYLLQLFTGNASAADCEGTILSIGNSDIYLLDLGRTFSSQTSAGSTLSLILHREKLEKLIPGKKLHGILFKAGQPETHLLANVITGIINLAPSTTETMAQTAENVALSSLALALHHNKTLAALDDQVFIPILRSRILSFIDLHLAEPSLDIKMIMTRFKVSRAHLYRMFEAEGGVMRAIRERRLDAACRFLISKPDTTIPLLGQLFGFSSPEHFQKSFRDRFNMTPNEIKQERSKLIVKCGRLSDMQDYLSAYTTHNGTVIRQAPSPKSSANNG
ncbi:AraC family transcriptional regulator [Ochrobactrum sp. SFR4]|uniref:helix-turn-helix domain-containing protein n=1 Tax=Ochrobactrum sp. SFR4 TaxID=2717368 RepID=UPI001C8BCF94|nr:AraC family transcriptional regulator [Ochrobactrum sp. SFR4]MBX8826578.1 helix-turn-helix transcriptional regulator [Ochrobactrum sp. SFR4]